MPVACCIAFDVSPILRPTSVRPAAMFWSRHTPWIAYESSTVASGYRAVMRGITPCVRSASASSAAMAAMSSGCSIRLPLQLVAELVLALLVLGHRVLVGAGVREAVGTDGHGHLGRGRARHHGLRVAVEVEHER